MPEIPEVTEWEFENAWRRFVSEYETKREISPSVLAQGLILFSESHGVLRPSFDDYTGDEFVELLFQVHMVRPDFELIGLGELLVELVGADGLTHDAEADLGSLVAALHEAGGAPALRVQRNSR
jgi:hypothetical protein